MLEHLLGLLAGAWESIRPWEVVPEYEAGIILRLGKHRRDLGPGLCFKCPVFDEVVTTSTAVTTMALAPQTLTTSDGHTIVVSAIVKYRIANARPYLLEVYNRTDVLRDSVAGAVKQVVTERAYDEISAVEPDVERRVRAECNRYGFRIQRITFADLGRVRTIRLMTDSGYEEEPD